MKNKIINTVLIILGIIILFSVHSYWSSKKYEAQKAFFVNSCVETFYYGNSYDLNEIIDNFVGELPSSMQNYIERFDKDYVATIDTKYNVESLCKDIFVFYREQLEEEENRYDYCESNICR